MLGSSGRQLSMSLPIQRGRRDTSDRGSSVKLIFQYREGDDKKFIIRAPRKGFLWKSDIVNTIQSYTLFQLIQLMHEKNTN